MRQETRFKNKLAQGKTINVILYLRVSGNRQEDEGTSLVTQEEDCTRYCNENGYNIIDIVSETHTGKQLDQRRKLMLAMHRCARGEADAIVYHKQDRIARNGQHAGVIRYDSEKYRYELLCVKEPYDENDPTSKITRAILEAVAEFELSKIQGRTTDGKIKRAQGGALLNGGRPRYGYSYLDTVISPTVTKSHTHYAILECEAEVIQKIDRLYLEGNSQYAIAKILTEEGIPTPNGNTIWGSPTIWAILSCTEYHGEGYAYKEERYINEKGQRATTIIPIEDRIKLPESVFPIIRSYETFLAIQERKKSAHSTANTCHIPEQVLLRGMIRCSTCGNVMFPHIDHKIYMSYRCAHAPNATNPVKHVVQIAASIVEPAVIDFLRELLKDISVMEKALTHLITHSTAQASVEKYEHAIEETRARQLEIGKGLDTAIGGVREIVIEKMNVLEREIQKLREYKSQVMGEGDRWVIVQEKINSVLNWLRSGDVNIDTATFERKRELMEVLGLVVYVTKGEDTGGRSPKRTTYTVNIIPLSDTASPRSNMMTRIHQECP